MSKLFFKSSKAPEETNPLPEIPITKGHISSGSPPSSFITYLTLYKATSHDFKSLCMYAFPFVNKKGVFRFFLNNRNSPISLKVLNIPIDPANFEEPNSILFYSSLIFS